MTATLDRIESTAWLVAAALGAAMSVRFFTVVASRAFPDGSDTSRVASPEASGRSPKDRYDRLLDLARAEPDAGAVATGSAGVAARLIRPQLYVNVGPERSTVYVNGVSVGRTPFIGEVTCRAGDLVRVDVDPPDAAPMRFTGRCQGTVLRVEKAE